MGNTQGIQPNNLLMHQGKIHAVCGFYYDDIYLIDIETGHETKASMHEVEPIPLSPEILEKVGFVDNQARKLFYHPLGISIHYGVTEYTNLFACQISHLKYLHHLQNLVHALTGKELVIEL